MVPDKEVVDSYVERRLSEMQTAKRFSISANRVRRILDKYRVPRRSISDAITNLYITKYGKRPFELRHNLTRRQEILKAVGVMLYWGEGTKKGLTVALANSDPVMIQVFLRFLREICGVHEKRLRVGLHYYRDHDPKKLIGFWSQITKIPLSQFDRPFLHFAGKGSYKSKSQYGTVAVRYSDARLLKLLQLWIAEYQRQVLE
ncbi:hypothetical protein HY969_05050 [Candidatus Kaiserbacteria bacterium]|nr:hypothetical protein [Candidatus Kaiserbacteria bacterium]